MLNLEEEDWVEVYTFQISRLEHTVEIVVSH